MSKKQPSFIPKSSASIASKQKLLNDTISKISKNDHNLGNHANIQIDFTYIQHQHQCFSDWDKEDMKSFWRFYNTAQTMTWDLALKQGGKGRNKTGLAPTPIPFDNLPCKDFIDTISQEISDFMEMRVDQKRRVLGFRMKHLYYVCILDKNHELV